MAEATDDLKRKARCVYERLINHYGQPSLKRRRDPLSELVMTILSQNTTDTNSGRAYASLREHFPEWREMMEAETSAVEEAIRVGGLANIKAPRIQNILQKLWEERGLLSLDFLEEMSVDEARAYLLSLHGVGPKTAACVLLFSMHMPTLPVDTHVHRVTGRLGLIPAKATPKRTRLLLEGLLPKEAYYPFHLNIILHGRTVCKARKPNCAACPLSPCCDYAQKEAGQDAEAKGNQ